MDLLLFTLLAEEPVPFGEPISLAGSSCGWLVGPRTLEFVLAGALVSLLFALVLLLALLFNGAVDELSDEVSLLL